MKREFTWNLITTILTITCLISPQLVFSQRPTTGNADLVISQINLNAQSLTLIVDSGIENSSELKAMVSNSGIQENELHIFSHGKPGHLLIQDKWLDASQITTWLESKKNNVTDIFIYGCNFAKGEKGKQAVSYLETALGVSIAASDDITGKDGDWELEVLSPRGGDAQRAEGLTIPNWQGNLQADNPFICDPEVFFMTHGSLQSTDVFTVSKTTNPWSFTPLGGQINALTIGFNGLGYNPIDDYLYLIPQAAFSPTNPTAAESLNRIYRIDKDGNYTSLTPSGTSIGGQHLHAATITSDGRMVLFTDNYGTDLGTGVNHIWVIDNIETTPTVVSIMAVNTLPTSGTGQVPSSDFRSWDLTYDPLENRIYLFNTLGNILHKLNPDDGFRVTSTQTVSRPSSNFGNGATFVDSNGDHFVYSQDAGSTFDMYRFNDGSNNFSSISSIASAPWRDGASCIPQVKLSGTVFNDTNGDANVNGTGIGLPDGTQLYANLVDNSGNVVAVVAVNSNGTYEFNGLYAGTYSIVLSTTQGTVGATPPAANLPAGWNNEGEDCCDNTGNDGNPNGTITSIVVSTTDVTNANFGIMIIDPCDPVASGNLDTDSDGISDICDLDDDNDGILDTVECAAQTYSVYTYNRASTATLATNLDVSIVGATTTIATIASQNALSIDLTYNGFNWHLLASGVEEDVSGNISVTFVPDVGTGGDFILVDAMLITDGTAVWVIDDGDAPWSISAGWTSQSNGSSYGGDNYYVGSPPFSETATWSFSSLPLLSNCDTDNDGIPDYLDLDSDGDGCPDAIEGGGSFTSADLVTDTNIDGGNVCAGCEGPVQDNLGTSSNADGTPTAGPTQGIGDSQDAGTQSADCTDPTDPCDPVASGNLDTDSDGISDICDLDDDNDGILDTVECAAQTYSVYTYNRASTATLATNLDVSIVGATTTIATIASQNALSIDLTYNGFNWHLLASGVEEDVSGNISVTFVPDVGTGGDFILVDAMLITDGTAVWVIDDGDAPWSISAGWTSQSNGSSYGGDNYYVGSPPFSETATWSFSSLPLLSNCDTDNDGIPDYLDLDSDGDGCPDAIEGGGSFTSADLVTDTNIDGGNVCAGCEGPVQDNLGTSSNADGTPTAGPTQGIGDSQDAGTQSADCTDPTDPCDPVASGNLDTDSDGISDICDLDDDNDGILDIDECFGADVVSWTESQLDNLGTTPFTAPINGNDIDFSWAVDAGVIDLLSTGFSLDNALTADVGTPITSITTGAVISSPLQNGSVLGTLTLDITEGVFEQLNLYLADMEHTNATITAYNSSNVALSTVNWSTASYEVNGASPASTPNPITINPTNLFLGATDPFGAGTQNDDMIRIRLDAVTLANADRIEIVFDRVGITNSRQDGIEFMVTGVSGCDTDEDSIPDYLDLDSDGDGCPDAIEGDGSFTSADLVTDTNIDGGNVCTGCEGPVQDNLGTSSNADGTPTTGPTQGIGDSQDAGTQSAECADPTDPCDPVASGNLDTDSDGISDLCDLDDDNDGITDIVEASGCAITGATAPQGDAASWSYYDGMVYSTGGNTNGLGFEESGFEQAVYTGGTSTILKESPTTTSFTNGTISIVDVSNTYGPVTSTNSPRNSTQYSGSNDTLGVQIRATSASAGAGLINNYAYNINIDFNAGSTINALGFDLVDIFDLDLNEIRLTYAVYVDNELVWEVINLGIGAGNTASMSVMDGSGAVQTNQTFGHNQENFIGLIQLIPFSNIRVEVELVNVTNTDISADTHGFDNFVSATLSCDFDFDGIQNHLDFDSGLLPVELVHFIATDDDDDANLDWRTASEVNNDYFSIQRSTDATHWEEIGTKEGYGSATEVHDYTIVDRNLQPGIYYYRLQQYDFDGSYEFSHIESVVISRGDAHSHDMSIYPNPIHVTEQVVIDGLGEEAASIRLYEYTGKYIANINTNNGVIDLSAYNIHSGFYLLEVIIDGQLQLPELFKLVVNE